MKGKTNFVIGAGRLGSSIAKELYSEGKNVLVIDIDENASKRLDEYGGYLEVFDATDLDSLLESNIKNAKSVTITTNSDNVNIFLANVCLEIFGIENVFVRLFDSRKAKLLNERAKMICPFDLSINDFKAQYKEIH